MSESDWRTWSTHVIEGFIAVNEITDNESLIQLIVDMEDELDKRASEEDLTQNWDAREGTRPYWA